MAKSIRSAPKAATKKKAVSEPPKKAVNPPKMEKKTPRAPIAKAPVLTKRPLYFQPAKSTLKRRTK